MCSPVIFSCARHPLDDSSTAKRLRNRAQGCRAARLPWGKSSTKDFNPERVASEDRSHNPVGVGILEPFFFPG